MTTVPQPRRVPQGKSLRIRHPDIAAQWSDRNELTPDDVLQSSQSRIFWVCPVGHEWEATVFSRCYRLSGCPYCAGKRATPGTNDLATVNPALALEWHPTRNTDSPNTILPKSGKKAWWVCSEGHEWESTVYNRSSGTGCPYCAGSRVTPGETDLGTTHPWVAAQLHPHRNTLTASQLAPMSSKRQWWVCGKGHEWESPVSDRTGGHGCPRCASAGMSKPEFEIDELVRSWGLKTRMHHRQIADGYEYDVTVPEKKVAIEFNGLYWHSEKFKERNYHRDKALAAEKAGWRVIHVWEDDWRDKPEVVKKMLARKLGVSLEERLNARSLDVRTVPVTEARELLDANHIQGSGRGSVRLGLYRGGELVAVALFLHRKAGEWELTRYGSSCIVRGGFSKLLSAFVKNHEFDRLVTFSDTTVSDGGLYESLGFVLDGEIAPDYSYVVRGSREHKFGYRLKRFQNDPELTYRDGLTERQLAELNGLARIYDAGKIRWAWASRVVD